MQVPQGCFPRRPPGSIPISPNSWLFPAPRYDDQVDSTVNALAWLSEDATKPGMAIFLLEKMRHEQRMRELAGKRLTRVKVPRGPVTGA